MLCKTGAFPYKPNEIPEYNMSHIESWKHTIHGVTILKTNEDRKKMKVKLYVTIPAVNKIKMAAAYSLLITTRFNFPSLFSESIIYVSTKYPKLFRFYLT